MPIYEYRCSSCGHELEVLQKFSDAPLSTCPSCHRDALTKKVSAAGFQLKGSGWYVTDFKGGGAKPPAKAADGDGKGGAAGADTKSESKTEARNETKSESAAPAAATGSTSGSTAES
jgi:putative FmdB family regulatory protein